MWVHSFAYGYQFRTICLSLPLWFVKTLLAGLKQGLSPKSRLALNYQIVQTDLKAVILPLPQLPKCWDRRCVPTFPIIWYLFNVLILCPLGIDWDAVLLSHIYGSSFSSGALFPQQRYLPHPYPWCVRCLCSLPYRLLVPLVHECEVVSFAFPWWLVRFGTW